MRQDFDRTDNLHRAPLRREFTSTTKPLIVTPTFVSRVDDTAPDERPQDEGSSRNRRGHGVRHPNRHPGALALEPDPNLAHEHWDEYWRKVYGPKFAWDEPGSSSELVLRYDQVHRIASGPSSFFPPPYRAMVDESGRLPSDPEKRVAELRRLMWDGLAYIVYRDEADIERALGQEKFSERIIADEQTAFRKVTRGIAREFILIPSERHRDPISLVSASPFTASSTSSSSSSSGVRRRRTCLADDQTLSSTGSPAAGPRRAVPLISGAGSRSTRR